MRKENTSENKKKNREGIGRKILASHFYEFDLVISEE